MFRNSAKDVITRGKYYQPFLSKLPKNSTKITQAFGKLRTRVMVNISVISKWYIAYLSKIGIRDIACKVELLVSSTKAMFFYGKGKKCRSFRCNLDDTLILYTYLIKYFV